MVTVQSGSKLIGACIIPSLLPPPLQIPGIHKEPIKIVQDNLNTHIGASLYKAFIPEEARCILDKLEFHYTPKHGSWLNMAEIELSVLARQCLDRRIPEKDVLKEEVAAWEKRRNQISCKADWQFTTVDARIKLKRLYPSLSY